MTKFYEYGYDETKQSRYWAKEIHEKTEEENLLLPKHALAIAIY